MKKTLLVAAIGLIMGAAPVQAVKLTDDMERQMCDFIGYIAEDAAQRRDEGNSLEAYRDLIGIAEYNRSPAYNQYLRGAASFVARNVWERPEWRTQKPKQLGADVTVFCKKNLAREIAERTSK